MATKRNYINFSIDGRIALLTLNRPPVNAFNRLVENELDEVFEELRALSEIAVIIIASKHCIGQK